MSKNLEIVVGVTEKATSVKAENVVLVNKHDTKLNAKTIENEVINYLHNINERDLKNASQTIKNINGKNKIETHKLRIPESKFQNRLLSLIYQKNVSFDNISFWIKIALAKYGKEGSVEIQRDIDSILIGVKSCNEAIVSLEAKLEKEYKKDSIWLATNNSADARYQIDILAGVENMESSIKVLHLVQVKTTTLDKDSIQNITEAHQNYLDNLPQLIGKLNKKEASASIKDEISSEIIDIDRRKEKEDQLVLLGLVFDQYINDIKDVNAINATSLYEIFKKEGGILSPFTVMGILKDIKLIEKYRDNNLKNKEAEKHLEQTADEIPFTKEESLVFYKKSHIHTIIDSAKIISIVMIGGKEVSKVELKHPYSYYNN